MNASTVFKNYLLGHLLDHCKMSPQGVEAIGAKFDALVKQAEPRQAFTQLLDSYGSCDAEQTTASILTELERLNREHAGIDKNNITRLQKFIDSHNRRVSVLSVEVKDDRGNIIDITEGARKEAKLEHPKFLPKRGFNYVSNGSFRGKPVQFDVEIEF